MRRPARQILDLERAAAAGLLGSLLAPVLYGALVAGRNQVSHHLVRLLLVAALAVLYWVL